MICLIRMPTKKKPKLFLKKGNRNEDQVEENGDAATVTQSTEALSGTATQGTTVADASPKPPPTPKRRQRKSLPPGPPRRSNRIGSTSNSVGDEANLVVAATSEAIGRENSLERVEVTDVDEAPAPMLEAGAEPLSTPKGRLRKRPPPGPLRRSKRFRSISSSAGEEEDVAVATANAMAGGTVADDDQVPALPPGRIMF